MNNTFLWLHLYLLQEWKLTDWQLGRGHPVNRRTGQDDINVSFTGQISEEGGGCLCMNRWYILKQNPHKAEELLKLTYNFFFYFKLVFLPFF